MDRNEAAEKTRPASEEQASTEKRPYVPPAIEDETVFESLAMGCTQTGKCGGGASTS
jgi:hypothetical protein